ncbi:MAG: glucose-6-phosphate dehydrogenase [Cyclobacteriaceae bacterium]
MENQVLVIFGASGDLTKRKLIPAVFNLFCQGFLPDHYAILGIGRSEYSDESFRKQAVIDNPHLNKQDIANEKLEEFAELIHYQSLNTKEQSSYQLLVDKLESVQIGHDIPKNIIFYLSTPPSLYAVIAQNLASYQLNTQDNGWKNLIVEKPFGYDLVSARELNAQLLEYFKEEQIYRIDHYLGKETVQNLMVTRFANSIFEPLWNRNYIHRIEITSAESVGVEKRGGYYDGSGALRDMIQNHLLQLVALVAMEPPSKMEATAIHNEKLKLFQSFRPLTQEDIHKNVIRGQYMASHIRGEDEMAPGYREEEGVNPESRTETYAALKFYIDNWRWADVPFYIRSGKRLPTRVSEVVIHFKPNHHHLFQQSGLVNSQNMLVFRIQPNEGVLLKFGLKVPGSGYEVEKVNMDFHYDELANAYVPEAYERLILDCMQSDATLFARGDSVEAAWEFVDPILNAWQHDPSIPIYGYPSGTWGPDNADELVEGENMIWRYPCKNLTDDGNFCEL